MVQRNRVESDDDWHRSDDSYSPRQHWRFRSPTRSVGPRFAYRRVMTLVSCDDDLDWEFALIRTLGIRPVLGGANGEEIEENGARNCPSCTRMQPESM